MTEVKRPAGPALNWLDRAILAVSPGWGARRVAARRAFSMAQNGFARIEAAENSEVRGSRWQISRLAPDNQLEQDLQTTRDRSRDIYQNDALGGAVDNKVNHVIGTGHTAQARIAEVPGLVTASQAEEYNRQAEQLYKRWEPRADRSGKRSLWMCSRLASRHNEFDGESLTVLSDVGRADKPIPLAVQVLDPERLNTPPEFAADPNVRLGIRYSSDNEILGYYIQKNHPGDTRSYSNEYEFMPPDRVVHVFEPWFAEQSRGLPWMTRALNRARDAKDYDEATILAAQVEACYAAYVKPDARLGLPGYQNAAGAATGTTAAGQGLQDITPATIKYLNPGEDIVFGTPTRPGTGFSPFMEWNYRRVAAAINWPYEMVVKNWNGLSFAAGRLVLTDAKKATQVAQKIMREMWLSRIWCRMVYEGVVTGEIQVDPRLYQRAPWEFESHVWIAPAWEYALNPGEEVAADRESYEALFATLEDILAKTGQDLEQFIARKSREKKLLQEADLVPAKKSATAPVSRETQSGEEPTTEPSEEPAGVAA